MIKLLNANLYKLFKDKTTYILTAVSIATALLVTFIYLIMEIIVDNLDSEFISIQGLVSGEMLFVSGIQLGQNIGIVMALGATMFVGKEFSQNTIRNKISIGFSKTRIYLSNFIMSVIIGFIFYITYELIIFTVAVPIFGWNESGFVFSTFMLQLACSLCILITFNAVLNMITMLTRSMVAGIIISVIGIVVVVVLLSSIQILGTFNESLQSTIDIITKSSFIGQSLIIGYDNSVSFLLWVLISSIIIGGGSTVLGCFLFEKLDVK